MFQLQGGSSAHARHEALNMTGCLTHRCTFLFSSNHMHTYDCVAKRCTLSINKHKTQQTQPLQGHTHQIQTLIPSTPLHDAYPLLLVQTHFINPSASSYSTPTHLYSTATRAVHQDQKSWQTTPSAVQNATTRYRMSICMMNVRQIPCVPMFGISGLSNSRKLHHRLLHIQPHTAYYKPPQTPQQQRK